MVLQIATMPPIANALVTAGLQPPDMSAHKAWVHQTADELLGISLTVERRTLTPLVLVRIQDPQPAKSLKILRFMNRTNQTDWTGARKPDAQKPAQCRSGWYSSVSKNQPTSY